MQGISALCNEHGARDWTNYARTHYPSKFSQLEKVVSAAPENSHADISTVGSGRSYHGNKFTPLHWAAFGGHRASIEKLLSLGFEVNTLDAFGQTPAHTASRDGHIQAIKILVSHGCDLGKAGDLPVLILQAEAVLIVRIRKFDSASRMSRTR